MVPSSNCVIGGVLHQSSFSPRRPNLADQGHRPTAGAHHERPGGGAEHLLRGYGFLASLSLRGCDCRKLGNLTASRTSPPQQNSYKVIMSKERSGCSSGQRPKFGGVVGAKTKQVVEGLSQRKGIVVLKPFVQPPLPLLSETS